MTTRVFVDTNVILRHVLGDNDTQSPAAGRFFEAVARGEWIAVLAPTVLTEVVYVLEKQPDADRATIRRALGGIIAMPNVEIPDKSVYAEVLHRYTERSRLSFADCYHIVTARLTTQGRLATFDRAAGRSDGIEWIRPE